MKAMILAAGLGTRLKPLTTLRPKALMPVGNRPVIDHSIAYLKEHGVREIVVNAHHLFQQLVDYLDNGRPFNMPIQVLVESEILGTGGGIKNTEGFWDQDTFVVMNGDIFTDVDISKAVADHKRNGNLVTMVLHDCEPFNQIRIDKELTVTDIGTENQVGRLAFTGIHIIEPEVLNYLSKNTYSNIIDCYRVMIQQGKTVRAHVAKGHYWRDMGTIDSYMTLNRDFLNDLPFLVGAGCRMHVSANLKEWAVIGNNVRLEENVEIRRSVLWDDVIVRKGAKIIGCVVTSNKDVNKDLIDEIY